jgi:2-succinyl-5-enolpyruvyl-6-hydroxy-3-cyclohexene-1-carboxylate synthase
MQHNQHIAELGPLLELFGIRHVVICPGSRNAPLIQLFTLSKFIHCHSIVDERSAGYIALGMARQLGEPVVVVTTSGTAVMNLAPAAAEAFHQEIPLILITADRPLEVIPQFNNQWLDQEAPFYSFSKGFYQLPVDLSQPEELESILSHVERLLGCCVAAPPGPVHINVPLAEPLYEPLPLPAPEKKKTVDETEYGEAVIQEPPLVPERCRILVLAGMGPPDRILMESLERLLRCRQAVVAAENIANLPGSGFCANPELLLAGANADEKRAMAPELVISFRGQVVSKRLKIFLDEVEGLEHQEVKGGIVPFLDHLAGQHRAGEGFSNDFLKSWLSAQARVLASAADRVNAMPFGNLSAMHRIMSAIPPGAVMHLGNSAAIRYAQLAPLRKELLYFSNRGTSGIDGCLSASVGAAMVSEGLHVLVAGDLSFVYDSNALWNKDFPGNLKVIVLNDGGGGIFRLLEGPDRMDFFEEFSVTHHPVSLELLSQSFGRSYRRAGTHGELEEELTGLFAPGSRVSVLEVDTAGSENSRIFKDFMDFNR